MIRLEKDSIDIGIATADGPAMTAFYRDVLGLEDLGEVALGGMTVRMLRCGTSTIKLVVPNGLLAHRSPGGMFDATGFRYLTISVSNLDEVVETCRAAGATVLVARTEPRRGMAVAVVADPDGNAIELFETAGAMPG